MVTQLLIKTVCYRLFAGFASGVVAYLVTGSAALALTLGVVDLFLKSLLYFVFELLWSRIRSKI